MNLDSSLEKVRGVGPKTLEQLHAAGLFAVRDILQFFPRKYEDFSALKDLSNLEPGKVLFKAFNFFNRRFRSIIYKLALF